MKGNDFNKLGEDLINAIGCLLAAVTFLLVACVVLVSLLIWKW